MNIAAVCRNYTIYLPSMLLHYLHCTLTIYFHYLEDTIRFTHIVMFLKKAHVFFTYVQVPPTTIAIPTNKVLLLQLYLLLPCRRSCLRLCFLIFYLFFQLEIQSLSVEQIIIIIIITIIISLLLNFHHLMPYCIFYFETNCLTMPK